MKQLLRLGTRGSPLALWQADHITELLLAAHQFMDVVEVLGATAVRIGNDAHHGFGEFVA